MDPCVTMMLHEKRLDICVIFFPPKKSTDITNHTSSCPLMYPVTNILDKAVTNILDTSNSLT